MIGYKAFNKDLSCRNFKYEIGKTYEFDGKPKCCKKGFHFCKSIAETYSYYPKSKDTRICKVEALGEIDTDDEIKYCTNKIRIIEEVMENWERRGNSISNNSGYCNSGDYNSGNYNSGYCNSGNYNSDNYNSGDRNSGYYNSGYYNSGYCNSGNYNSGYCNSGDYNSGNYNYGYCNSGNYNSDNYNSGDRNSGYYNSGYYNSGYCNSGNYNSGYCNSGDYNSGDYNSGNYNSGLFNTNKKPKMMMFDEPSDWTYNDWNCSNARRIMCTCPYTHTDFITKLEMTDEEKENHPEYKTMGGYIKTFVVTEEDKLKWWNDLPDSDKEVIESLPNFNFEKFRECVGF